jgi:hypothetical protein
MATDATAAVAEIKTDWTVRTVVAGNGFNGPDFFFCIIACSSEQYENGEHYDRAKQEAREHGYEGEMVAFDEIDGPAGLFELFLWPSASVINL